MGSMTLWGRTVCLLVANGTVGTASPSMPLSGDGACVTAQPAALRVAPELRRAAQRDGWRQLCADVSMREKGSQLEISIETGLANDPECKRSTEHECTGASWDCFRLQ